MSRLTTVDLLNQSSEWAPENSLGRITTTGKRLHRKCTWISWAIGRHRNRHLVSTNPVETLVWRPCLLWGKSSCLILDSGLSVRVRREAESKIRPSYFLAMARKSSSQTRRRGNQSQPQATIKRSKAQETPGLTFRFGWRAFGTEGHIKSVKATKKIDNMIITKIQAGRKVNTLKSMSRENNPATIYTNWNFSGRWSRQKNQCLVMATRELS